MSSHRSSGRIQQHDSPTPESTRSNTNTTKTKSTEVYDRNFQQHLVDNYIYPHGYEYPDGSAPEKPTNWKDIHKILGRPRRSVSPSRFTEEDHERFCRADIHASIEKQVLELVLPVLEGEIGDVKCRSGGIHFTNLDPLTDGTLKPGNPGIYYGARPEQLKPQVREELSRQIMPSTEHDLPTAPNFFLTAKGPDGSLAVAGRQACYDGALGARGMHSLQSYEQEPVYDNNAYTVTSIYHGGALKMYTSHVRPPRTPRGRPEYCMNQLRSFSMTDTADTFRQGAAAYRNARDWAKEQRDDAIMKANDRAIPADAEATDQGVTAATETGDITMSQESRTSQNEDSTLLPDELESPDEDTADHILPAKRTNKDLEDLQGQQKRRNVD